MNKDILLKNIKLENLPSLMAYITPDENGESSLSRAIKYLRIELPEVVVENGIHNELDSAIYAIGSTITDLDKIHHELIERIPSYPEPAYW